MIGARVSRPSPDRPCASDARQPAANASSDCGGGCRRGLDDHLDVAGIGDRQHAETEPAAEIAIARVALAALAAGGQPGREPDFVGGGGAIDRLQHQFEIEGKLEFADHHDRRIVAAERHEVAAADLALDREAELFEEAFDGKIKRGFQDGLRRRERPRMNVAGSSRIPAKRLIGRYRAAKLAPGQTSGNCWNLRRSFAGHSCLPVSEQAACARIYKFGFRRRAATVPA